MYPGPCVVESGHLKRVWGTVGLHVYFSGEKFHIDLLELDFSSLQNSLTTAMLLCNYLPFTSLYFDCNYNSEAGSKKRVETWKQSDQLCISTP